MEVSNQSRRIDDVRIQGVMENSGAGRHAGVAAGAADLAVERLP